MPGVHRLQHVQRFAAPHFAHHDAFRPHAQRITHQIANDDLAAAVGQCRRGFHAYHVLLMQLKFGCIFDRANALILRNKRRDNVEQCRLA